MPLLENLVHMPLARALGWTLFYSLWEGAVLALVLLAALFLTRSPRARYVCACLAMLATLAAFGITLCVLTYEEGGRHAVAIHPLSGASVLADQFTPALARSFHMGDALASLAPFWIIGVILFYLRSIASWVSAQRLKRRGVCRAPDPWPRRLETLCRTLRVSRPVTLLETCLSEIPVVVGHLRPVILAPVGMLSGMSDAQMEAILLHELAHIVRCDYLVNLLQTLVEGFLFYHPAVWWISGIVRAERENCCDDLVVSAGGDAREYAAALSILEHTRCAAHESALAAAGGNLVKRIRRLLYPLEERPFQPFFSTAILGLVAAGALLTWQASILAQNPDSQAEHPNASRYTQWLNEDVVYIIEKQERAAFLNLKTDEERDHFIEQFWLRRDPTPGTPQNEFKEEHYRRIAYANSHFGWRSLPGWRTDRGRIYIVYGPPDEKEVHPTGRPAKAGAPAVNYPVEDWLYHQIKDVGQNVLVEFEDTSRSGDFRMTKDPDR